MKQPIVFVILYTADGEFMLQWRDNIPRINYPNHWSMFGGGIEKDEEPKAAAVREIREELNLELKPDGLGYLGALPLFGTQYHAFYYEVNSAEIANAVILEGQAFGLHSLDIILSGNIDGIPIVAHHIPFIEWFWNEFQK